MSSIWINFIIPENATKLITKNLKGRESSKDEAWHKPLAKSTRVYIYHSEYGGEQD